MTLSGLSASEPAGQRVLGPLTIQGSIVIGDTVVQSLNAGDNVISVPSGSTGVVIIPPATGGTVLLYRTALNPADIGLPISPSSPFVHTFPSPGPSTITVNASTGVAAFTSFWFW